MRASQTGRTAVSESGPDMNTGFLTERTRGDRPLSDPPGNRSHRTSPNYLPILAALNRGHRRLSKTVHASGQRRSTQPGARERADPSLNSSTRYHSIPVHSAELATSERCCGAGTDAQAHNRATRHAARHKREGGGYHPRRAKRRLPPGDEPEPVRQALRLRMS